MANLLKNPSLANWKHGRYFTERNEQVGTIEYPEHWEFITVPKEDDPEKLPQSLHRDNGFVISAGYRAWEAGYMQRGIALQGNQRYQAKATFKPDVNFPAGQQVDLTAVTWRFVIEAHNGQRLEQDWSMTDKNQFKQNEEHTFIFETQEPVTINYYFMARSYYAGNSCDLHVYQLALEPVAQSVGGDDVPTLGSKPEVSTPSTAPTAPEMPKPGIIDEEVPENTVTTLTTNRTLASVATSEELEIITTGLRTLAKSQANRSVIDGLNKLAEVLDRLR